MITSIVTMLGGWRATALAAACIALMGYAGWQKVELWRAEATIIDLQQTADRIAAEDAALARKATEDARSKEQAQAQAFADAETQHARELADAQTNADHLAADLRAGTVRLRHELTACRASGLPEAPAAPSDGSAELRAAVAQTVAIGAQCDADIRSLQAKLRAER